MKMENPLIKLDSIDAYNKLYGMKTLHPEKISGFRFFDYSEMESLHLSEDERSKFLYCLDMISQELKPYPV